MQQYKCKCARCGTELAFKADYLIPGISGYMTGKDGKDGKTVIFVDPTQDYLCFDCVADLAEEKACRPGYVNLEEMFKENSNG